jgi:hypothetical protein
MARTRHQTVTRVAPKAGKRSAAKNSDLKQAAHQGKAPVKDARNAQAGYTAVPASVAALTPGSGPQMSSASTGSRAAAHAIQNSAPVVSQQGSKTGRKRKAAKKR